VTAKKTKINLFEYTDYRKFLKDWYESAKLSVRGFSYRSFAKKAGFASPNFLKLVMDGDRNLTEESLTTMMNGLGFTKQEQDFFRNLVFYNQSETDPKRNHYYQKLAQSKKYNDVKAIEKGEFEYCSTWYHAVVRELVASKEFDGTPAWLAEKIYPPITTAQAQKSLELLLRLGFIKKVKDNHFEQSQTLLSTGSEVISLALYQYHQSMLELTKEVLEKLPARYRDVSALTLGISKTKLPIIKKMIGELRKELLKVVGDDEHPEDVVQVNIQMFPLTHKAGGNISTI